MSRVGTVIYTLIFVVLLTLLGGVVFIYSGVFNVSARWEDGPLLEWVLETTRERSIEVRKDKVEVPADLDDPKKILAGFKHYQEMCVGCHRSPGQQPSEIGKGLNPKPPNFAKLKEEHIDLQEFFLVIRDGIRMTAMPAWGVTHSDEEIWTLVAFMQLMPRLTPEQYQVMVDQVGSEQMADEDHHGGAADDHHDKDQTEQH